MTRSSEWLRQLSNGRHASSTSTCENRIGLWSPNRIEWILTQYATAKAGLILVNLNPGYRAAELEYALNKVECRALITADQFKTTHYISILRELAPELDHCPPGALRAARLPHLMTVIHFADTDNLDFSASPPFKRSAVQPSTPGWKNCPGCCNRTIRSISSLRQAPRGRRRRRR